ncbi:DUF4189 domain-containing protein [Sphingopyxis microcysteis]|uniref:DUF4189 domain-containing protein n=1 Tax=Sphingopyxis microcysteis TaxID=2484145 RepID=UPI00144891E9|nr:DUF4189 domain-containing protein [Sphingopyxis microcysteis]
MRPSTAARAARWPLLLARIAAAVLFLLALAQPARAAYPCPNGPGPGEVQVGMADGGHGIATLPLCNRVGSTGDAPGDLGAPDGSVMVPRGATYTYGSIAWHADAADVWMVGNSGAASIAEGEALAACNRAMGGGCTSIGTWHNSAMTILRDRYGGLISAWDGEQGVHSAATLAACSAKQLLPCEILGTFPAGRRRHAPAPAAVRKSYAAGAWVDGTDGFDSRLYIASGQADAAAAGRRALAACAAATKRRCAILAQVGNGVIQPYRLGDDNEQSATVETSARRAAQAAQVNCERHRQRCELQRSYDSRVAGDFVHEFNPAPR